MLVRNTYKLKNGDFVSNVADWINADESDLKVVCDAAEQEREFGAVAVEVEWYDERIGFWVSIKKWELPKMVAYSQKKYVVRVFNKEQ